MSNTGNRTTTALAEGSPAVSTKYKGNYKTVIRSKVYVGTFRKVMESKYGPKLELEFLNDVKGVHFANHCEATSLAVTEAPK